jgi:hypothetical protein
MYNKIEAEIRIQCFKKRAIYFVIFDQISSTFAQAENDRTHTRD